MMEKISWISCNWFLDTDLPIVARLKKHYHIRLIVVVTHDSKIDYQKLVERELGDSANIIEVEFFFLKYRQRSPRNILKMQRFIRKAKIFHPHLYYISYQGIPYGLILYKLLLPKRRCAVSCHNVTTPTGATNEKIAVKITKWWLNSFKNINVFSKSQEQALLKAYPNKNVLMTPFFLKSYGNLNSATNKVESRPIRFLSFGNVVRYKRIDLLIEAVNILVKRGVSDFVVKIAGNCNNWKDYEKLIKYPEKFELLIRRIPNEDVSSLFEDAHYFVLPYQDIAQSGSMTVAFNYNVPTIVSDIPGFKDFVEDGATDLCFKSQDANSLANVMQCCIEEHKAIYQDLCNNLRQYVRIHYAEERIVELYKSWFSKIIEG